MEKFFETLKSIIDDLSYNEDLSVQELVSKGDADLIAEWDNCDHPTTGRKFYDLVIKGVFDTRDFQFIALPVKNPQRYKKMLVDKPIFIDESDIDIKASLSDTLKILLLMGKTLAIMPINRITPLV